ncbi:hypothetical protein GQX74_011283 [Glossina fuscipes]|nr:hypothetical protein GQX74_011283 [Glossina fuscipes]
MGLKKCSEELFFLEERCTIAQTASRYNDIIAREICNWFDHPSMSLFHLNSMKTKDLFHVRVQLLKQGMRLNTYAQKIINEAVRGSRYEAILPFFDSRHCTVYILHQEVVLLLRITRKVPMVLLVGITANTLIHRKNFQRKLN